MRESATFRSNGLELKGHYYLPEGTLRPLAAVVMGGGRRTVKELIQAGEAGAGLAEECL
jgi:hypothetical protein